MKAPSKVEVHPVAGRRERILFIRLAEAIYRDDPSWVQPLLIERLAFLDDAKNPYFQHAEARFWIARRDGIPVGRISAQIDRLVEERTGRRIGHFGHFESVADEAVAAALFDAAETWLKERGCVLCQGPFNLSINGECGLLVDGFETPPAILMGHARSYYERFVIAQGYAKAIDLYAYELDLLKGPPERITRFVEASKRRPEYRLRTLDMTRYDAELRLVVDIFNDAWSANWGFLPLTEAEAEHMAKELRPLIDRNCIQFCDYRGETLAMFVTLPDLNSLIRDFGGGLLPFNWLKLLWRLRVRYPKRHRVPLMGVRRKVQNSRQGAAMAMMLIESVRQTCVARGGTWAELSWILENNGAMRSILEEIGCVLYKTYRIYEKAL